MIQPKTKKVINFFPKWNYINLIFSTWTRSLTVRDELELKKPFGKINEHTQPTMIPMRMAIAIRDPRSCCVLSLRPAMAADFH